jgi:hypothetical protein
MAAKRTLEDVLADWQGAQIPFQLDSIGARINILKFLNNPEKIQINAGKAAKREFFNAVYNQFIPLGGAEQRIAQISATFQRENLEDNVSRLRSGFEKMVNYIYKPNEVKAGLLSMQTETEKKVMEEYNKLGENEQIGFIMAGNLQALTGVGSRVAEFSAWAAKIAPEKLAEMRSEAFKPYQELEKTVAKKYGFE